MSRRRSFGRELLWTVLVLGVLYISAQTLIERARESSELDRNDATCQQYAAATSGGRHEFAEYWLNNFRDHDGKPDVPQLVDDFRDDITEACASEPPAEKATTAASRLYVAGRDLYGA